MSRPYTIQSASTFYPLPPLSNIESGVVYTPHPLFSQYYSTYSRVIDKDYYLERYEQRYDNPPDKKIIDIWGDEGDDKEWAFIANIMDERLAGVVMRMFLLGESPFYLEDYIRAQRPFFSSTIKKTNKILSFPRVCIETNKYLNEGNLQKILHITKNKDYLYWDWEKILTETINLMPNKGKVIVNSVTHASRIINILMDNQFEEIEEDIWQRNIVPTKTLHFNTVY